MKNSSAENHFTPEEYLALERQVETRNEYLNGRIRPLSGGNRWHTLIVVNLTAELSTQLKARPCEMYAIAMRLLVQPTGLYTYPDISVTCGEPLFDDSHSDTLLNPTVLIEVLSPSTEAYDRGEKFTQYRRLDSLQDYVLIVQDTVQVEHFRRRGDLWVLSEINTLDDELRLKSIDCHVPLREIYDKVV